jgi:glycosyltransferase involved in cell wall biosynthesis
MKILHVSDCYLPRLGGIETQVHGLARGQIAAGHTVEVATATPRARHDRTTDEVIDGVPVRRITVDLPFELPVHPRAGREIRRVLESGRYDVLHVHAGVVSPFAFAAAPVAVDAAVPMVITIHSLWGYATPMFRALDALAGWSRWPVVWSAVSDVAAGPLRRVAGPGVEVAVLPNGIDLGRWRVDPLPRSPQDVVMAATMRLAARKRPLPLLRMLRRVREGVSPSVRLRVSVVGEGPQRAAMERYLHRHRMQGWVDLPGRFDADQLRELYRRADVFVAPARLESFGIAALEARTAGLPVVASSRAGIREFVASGREGLLAGTDGEMVAALARLANEPGLRRSIADHNRAVAPEMSWPHVVARCDLAYQRARSLLG